MQRINLTTALGTSLVNTLFVLDEPSIGLHPRDIERINGAMPTASSTSAPALALRAEPSSFKVHPTSYLPRVTRLYDPQQDSGTLPSKLTLSVPHGPQEIRTLFITLAKL